MSSNEMDMANRVQILDETVCISHVTNTYGKGMNTTISPHHTLKIDLVSHPAHGGLVYVYISFSISLYIYIYIHIYTERKKKECERVRKREITQPSLTLM